MKPTRFLSLLVPPLLAMLLAGCASHSPALDGFTIGFSTPNGNDIWIREAVFDDAWTVTAGIVSCCWREAGKMTGIGPGPMPSSVRVRWDDESRGVIYEAQTELPADLTERAIKLPKYEWKSDGLNERGHYLIIGLRDAGSMTVWLSNAPHDRNLTGRVLHEVGTAEGHIVREMRPEERRPVGDRQDRG